MTLSAIDPKVREQLLTLLEQWLSIDDSETIVPLRVKREDVSKIRAVKLRDQEIEGIKWFQDYLYDRHFIPENTFTALFVYVYNLAYTQHKQVADEEARKGGAQ